SSPRRAASWLWPSMGVGVGLGALGQYIEPAAIGALHPPLFAQVEINFWMAQGTAAAIAGNAVSINSDDFKRLGHDLTPLAAGDDSGHGGPGHAFRLRAHRSAHSFGHRIGGK